MVSFICFSWVADQEFLGKLIGSEWLIDTQLTFITLKVGFWDDLILGLGLKQVLVLAEAHHIVGHRLVPQQFHI